MQFSQWFNWAAHLLADNRVKVAICTFVLSASIFLGVPREKEDAAVKLIIAGHVLSAVLVARIDGKTPPSPSKPAGPPDWAPDQADHGSDSIRLPNFGYGTKSIILLGMLLLPLTGGCATSKQFQLGASQLGPGLADAATKYVQRDSALDEVGRSQRIVEADALKQASTDQASISRPKVESAWDAVKPWYIAYIVADTRLTDRERLLRQLVIAEFDRMIANDKSRPLAIFGLAPTAVPSPVLTAPPQAIHPPPASQPAAAEAPAPSPE